MEIGITQMTLLLMLLYCISEIYIHRPSQLASMMLQQQYQLVLLMK